jgi:hypothetical protein
MKMKLTPLNLVSAISLLAAIGLLLDQKWILSAADKEFKFLFVAFAVLALFGSFLIDQVFRKLIASTSKLWLFQFLFIVFTLILIFIFKQIFIQ